MRQPLDLAGARARGALSLAGRPPWTAPLDDGPLSVPFTLTMGRRSVSAELHAVVTSYRTLGYDERAITVQSLHDVHVRADTHRFQLADEALESLLARCTVKPDWAASAPASRALLVWRRTVTIESNHQFRLSTLPRRARRDGPIALFHPAR